MNLLHRQSALKRDSSSESHEQRVRANPVLPCPLRSGLALINLASAGVALLFLRGGPPAVARLVVAVVVYAVKRVFRRWSAPHVCEEILKDMPPLTDFDPTTAITSIPTSFWVAASLAHRGPSHPLLAGPQAMSRFEATAVGEAAATPALAVAKRIATDFSRLAAGAATHEPRVVLIRSAAKDRPVPEDLTCDVFEHTRILTSS